MTKIRTEYITLGQLLKIENIFSTGGEVKMLINTLDITVNGIKENRRGRKLYVGDKVCVLNKTFTIE